MKKFLLVFILMFSLFFFCGCQKQSEPKQDYVKISISYQQDGKIVQRFAMSVNSRGLDEVGATNIEKVEFCANLTKKFGEIRNKYLLSFAVVYLENPKEEFKINQGVLLSEPTYLQKEDEICFEIVFANIDAFNYYHASKNSSNANNPLFIKKVESKGELPFSGGVGDMFKQMYLSSAQGLSFYQDLCQRYSPDFIYDYSTRYSMLRSDADEKITDENGNYHHIWISSINDLEKDCTITLYYYLINKGVWILCITVIPLLALCIYVFVTHRKVNKNNLIK